MSAYCGAYWWNCLHDKQNVLRGIVGQYDRQDLDSLGSEVSRVEENRKYSAMAMDIMILLRWFCLIRFVDRIFTSVDVSHSLKTKLNSSKLILRQYINNNWSRIIFLAIIVPNNTTNVIQLKKYEKVFSKISILQIIFTLRTDPLLPIVPFIFTLE